MTSPDHARTSRQYLPPRALSRSAHVAGRAAYGGRIDDVLNVSGHRTGTMEIESALVAFTGLVAEAAVVGRPWR